MRRLITVALLVHLCLISYTQTWSNVGDGLPSSVESMAIYNGELYVGGGFQYVPGTYHGCIYRWNDSEWDTVGSGCYMGEVTSLCVYNNELYVGGNFLEAGGLDSTRHLAKWDGESWHSVGNATGSVTDQIHDMCVYDGYLYVAGQFNEMGGIEAKKLARYDGTSWSDVGGGVTSGLIPYANKMCVFNNELYVGGYMSKMGNVSVKNIARWDGSQWHPVGGGITDWGVVTALINDTINNIMHVGGGFSQVDCIPTYCYAQWNGSIWSVPFNSITSGILDFALYNGKLYCGGGSIPGYDTVFARIMETCWEEVWANATVNVMEVYNNKLYLGYSFGGLGNHIVSYYEPNSVAKIDDTSYHSLGQNIPNPFKEGTSIPYSVENNGQSRIQIHDLSGKLLFDKELNPYSNSLEVDTSGWPSGTYIYSLMVDNEVVDSRKMVVTKKE